MRSTTTSHTTALLTALLALSLHLQSQAAQAQGVLVRGTTTANLLELRSLAPDSVPFSQTTPGLYTLRLLANGQTVSCGEGDRYCRYYRSGATASAVPLLQDLDITAWGLGQGLSAHAGLRVRSALGSTPDLWPRANDHFDAMSAYLQLDRTRYTARLGRQYTGTGLGVYNFDGAMMSLRPSRRLTLEGFAGKSLLQGVNESLTTSELAALDELPPDRGAYLLGVQVRARPTSTTAAHAAYQRELRDNRSALYSERVAMDATWRARGGSVEGAWQQDLAMGVTNELRLRVRTPTVRRTALSAEVRRYRPFFELWTIWGAFSPVGFDEGRLQADWMSRGAAVTIVVHGARRRWQDTDAGLGFAELRRDGWRLGGASTWRVAPAWHVNGSYSADIGAGASRTEGEASVHYMRGNVFLGANATAFQSISEFRVGTGRLLGFGGDAGWQLSSDLRVVGSGTVYRQMATHGLPPTDWTQRRATLRMEWTAGSDPGRKGTSAAAKKPAAIASTAATPQSEPRFPHARHATLFPQCAGCHAGMSTGDKVTMFPENALCGECHNNRDQKKVAWRTPAHTPSNLRFDHAAHNDVAGSLGASCSTCHTADGDGWMHVSRATPAQCQSCHTHRASAHLADDNRCSSCHVSLSLAAALPAARIAAFPKPASHDAKRFTSTHASAAKESPAQCAVCHARETCATCHVNASAVATRFDLAPDARVAGLVKGKTARYVTPGSHTTGDFPIAHGTAAEPGGVSCATCHAPASCQTCHTGTLGATAIAQLAWPEPGGAQGVQLNANRQPWLSRQVHAHSAGFSKTHGVQAATDRPGCEGCHTKRDCAQCHAGESTRTFHPANFAMRHAPEAYNRETECQQCHSREVFCRSCHVQLGMTSKGTTGGAYHNGAALWIIQHGQAARQALQNCTTCHQQRDCMQCHAQSGRGINPHGRDFNAEKAWKANRLTCLRCHFKDPLGR